MRPSLRSAWSDGLAIVTIGWPSATESPSSTRRSRTMPP